MSARYDVIQVNLSDHQKTMGQPGSSDLQRGTVVLAVGGASEAFRLRLGGHHARSDSEGPLVRSEILIQQPRISVRP